MSITNEEKQQLIKEYAIHDGDTGSSEVQIAILTKRINTLTEHMKENKKDFSTRRGLLILVSRRNRLLSYLRGKNMESYKALIAKLGLRK
ncbi:MAG: 30S ribosomal protein S15 [Rickettsiales bacterium]|jgi:small subunit ribosomal protein S15|nr:30S ribosomal protein S15 [Rickettsiales bacterium]